MLNRCQECHKPIRKRASICPKCKDKVRTRIANAERYSAIYAIRRRKEVN